MTLTTTAADASEFVDLGGDCSGLSCDLVMSAKRSVTAQFAFVGYDLTVNVQGQGAVISDPGSLVCPGNCSDTFGANRRVTVSASADPGRTFACWQTPSSLRHGKSGFCTTGIPHGPNVKLC